MIRLSGLNVDEHIGDARVCSSDRVFDLMRDSVAGADGNGFVHTDMQVDIELEAHLSDEAFFNVEHAGHGCGRSPNAANDLAPRRGIHDFAEGGLEETITVGADEGAGEEGRPGIGTLPARATDKRDRDANERRDRSERVGPMMPGVGLHRRALDILPEANDGAVEQFFHNHNHDEDDEGERLRRMMGRKNRLRALEGETESGGEHA